MFSKKVKSIDELFSVAQDLICEFSDQQIFALYGEMGAGKTTFIQSICKVLGSDDYVTSPTFALVNEYSNKNNFPIFHFDFYRIKDIEEAFDIGYEEYMYNGNYCFIEWPEMIEPILPENIVEVFIEADDSGVRHISAQIRK
ncbi:MAG: tRNA (adenosine(37)-N6)-threonylcarbamoyltransferase complex ATPase subunit type 1 TsaE [Mariniphaga sp.]|nr:tRNA (adenosine(37)-N6)-threonylcarbamoyltransferase complex ATPase subunit type 1 TsaE [Mariniphaga sp.]